MIPLSFVDKYVRFNSFAVDPQTERSVGQLEGQNPEEPHFNTITSTAFDIAPKRV